MVVKDMEMIMKTKRGYRIEGRYGFIYKQKGGFHYKSYLLACKPQKISWYQVIPHLLFGNGLEK